LEKKRILITGAGAPGGPGIIKAVSKEFSEVHTCDVDPYASGRFLNLPFVAVPGADDEHFIPFVLEYCQKNKIQVVLPLVTKELFKFSQAKTAFLAKNIKIIVSNYDSLCIANDKGKLYQYLASNGIAVPQFEVVESIERLVSAAEKLNYPYVPICIKPTISNGSRGVRILQESICKYELLFNHKPGHLYTTLNEICEILKGKNFPQLLVSEYLPGKEFTVDTIISQGVPSLILPRSRMKINSGISVRGSFEKNDEIIDYSNKILRSLYLQGPIGLQVKENIKGEFRLLEINPRLQGTSVAALGMGINLPAIAVQQEFEEVIIDSSQLRWGTSFVRYYEELFY